MYDKTKTYSVAGGLIRNGVFLPHGGLGRNGAAKKLTDPSPAHGMRRTTRQTQSAYHHGVAVQDEPLTTKISQSGKAVPIHNGMGSERPEYRGANYGPDHGSSILNRDRQSMETHGDHLCSKSACLPPKR